MSAAGVFAIPCWTRRPSARGRGLAASLARVLPALAPEALHRVHELARVLEVPVDRGEAHVGHFVQGSELRHHGFTDRVAPHFAHAERLQPALHAVHHRFQRVGGDGSLLGRAAQAAPQLGAIEGLAPPVALDDVEGPELDLLVGGEALIAGQALPPAANGAPFLGRARIDHAIFQVTTRRALHGRPPDAGPDAASTAGNTRRLPLQIVAWVPSERARTSAPFSSTPIAVPVSIVGPAVTSTRRPRWLQPSRQSARICAERPAPSSSTTVSSSFRMAAASVFRSTGRPSSRSRWVAGRSAGCASTGRAAGESCTLSPIPSATPR